jgi:hypothetical protein
MYPCTKPVGKASLRGRIFGRAVLAVLWMLAGVAGAAAGESCLQRTVLVSVLNAEGNAVADLTVADFQAEFRGQPVKIHSAEFARRPARIVVLLDASGSVLRRAGKWRFFRQSAENIGTTLPGDYALGLVVFSEKTLFQVRPEEGRDAYLAALRELPADQKGFPPPPRRTAIRDAIVEGIKLLEPVQPGVSLYLITDGGENQSRASRRQIEEQLLRSGVRLFMLVLNFEQFEPVVAEPELMYPTTIQEVAVVSGGVKAYFPSRDSRSILWFGASEKTYQLTVQEIRLMETILRMLYISMVASYRLELEFPRAVDKPRKWKLEVVDSKGKTRKGLTVAFPGNLLPCENPEAPEAKTEKRK